MPIGKISLHCCLSGKLLTETGLFQQSNSDCYKYGLKSLLNKKNYTFNQMVVPVYFPIVGADWGKERVKLQQLLWESQPPVGAPLWCLWFLGGSDGKETACSAGDLGLTPESGRSPGGWLGSPLQYSGLENSMDGSLAGYSPWGRKQSGTAEQLSRHAWSLGAWHPVWWYALVMNAHTSALLS